MKAILCVMLIVVSSIAAFGQTTVKGNTTLTVPASDATTAIGDTECGVAYVQFYNGAATLGPRLTSSPYSYVWDTTLVPNGTYQITARATDRAGLTACDSTKQNTSNPSPVATLIVNNAPPQDVTPPTVGIIVPLSGAIIDSVRQTIQAAATDEHRITRMQILINGQSRQSNQNQNSISMNWNTRPSKGRNVTITARAQDEAGNIGSSDVEVTVR